LRRYFIYLLLCAWNIMKKRLLSAILIVVLLVPIGAADAAPLQQSRLADTHKKTTQETAPSGRKRASLSDIGHAFWQDLKSFYAPRPMLTFAGVLSGAAILANTPIDAKVARWYQRDIRSSTTNKIAHAFKWQGQNWPMITDVALTLTGYAANQDMNNGVFGWASRSLQAILVGAPVLGASQVILGGGRPDANKSSHWRFMGIGPAASGHSFYGAIPWLTAAHMVHNTALKISLYTLSTFTAFSRVNDNRHYLSQTILGWTIAYLATSAVSASKTKMGENLQISPIVTSHMVGADVELSY
jgi:hypothetical protein